MEQDIKTICIKCQEMERALKVIHIWSSVVGGGYHHSAVRTLHDIERKTHEVLDMIGAFDGDHRRQHERLK